MCHPAPMPTAVGSEAAGGIGDYIETCTTQPQCPLYYYYTMHIAMTEYKGLQMVIMLFNLDGVVASYQGCNSIFRAIITMT